VRFRAFSFRSPAPASLTRWIRFPARRPHRMQTRPPAAPATGPASNVLNRTMIGTIPSNGTTEIDRSTTETSNGDAVRACRTIRMEARGEPKSRKRRELGDPGNGGSVLLRGRYQQLAESRNRRSSLVTKNQPYRSASHFRRRSQRFDGMLPRTPRTLSLPARHQQAGSLRRINASSKVDTDPCLFPEF